MQIHVKKNWRGEKIGGNIKIVWKTIKAPSYEVVKHAAKRAVKKNPTVLYSHAKTRKSSEMRIEENCKTTTEKELTNQQSIFYNRILDERRKKYTLSNKKRGKKNVQTK